MDIEEIRDPDMFRIMTIINPDDEPEEKTVCHRHNQEMNSTYAHVRTDESTVYHTYGEKRFFYCPNCVEEFLSEAGVPMVEHASRMALLIATREHRPDSDEAANKRLWEPCEDEDHHQKFMSETGF